MENTELFQRLIQAEDNGMGYALLTILNTGKGTSRTGGMMAVLQDGTPLGTIGGGAAEKLAIGDAQRFIAKGLCGQRTYSDRKEGAEAGSACGSFTVWIETFSPRKNLVIFGAGHVGTALMRIAKPTGFYVTLVDTRGEEVIGEAMSLADEFIPIHDISADTAALDLPRDAFLVSTMYSHLADQCVLEGVLPKNFAYLGMIGSRAKRDAIFKGLGEKGFTQEDFRKVHCPIGLPLGGATPEDIAVSILAEIVQIKNQRPKEEPSRAEV